MSRIGLKPISLPEGVTYEIKDGAVSVKGPKGEVSVKLLAGVSVHEEGGALHCVLEDTESRQAHKNHGTFAANLHNAAKGVSEGFETVQEFVGVGYKAEAKGQILEMALGFSHNIFMEMPPEIKIETINERGKNPILKMRSYDKQLLGQVAAKIRSMRKPEPYKGKGIKFEGEVLRRKAGKSAGK